MPLLSRRTIKYRATSVLFAHALELIAVRLLVHELAGVGVALGKVFLTHDLGFQLRTFLDRAVAVTVACRFVGGHDDSSFRFLGKVPRPSGERRCRPRCWT